MPSRSSCHGSRTWPDPSLATCSESPTIGARRNWPRRPIEILLVEDNAADVRLTMEALREHGVRDRVSVARSGDEALACLRRQGAFDGTPGPDLILLDLNLPGKDGRQLLAEIKGSPELKTIPVIVLTTSADERDVRDCYQLDANAYVVKPVDFDQFLSTMRAIEEFWLARARLPRAER
jgi:CheY-like chemotaxis protein